MLISICLPSLNTRPFLEERMESLLAQTLTDWELIVCDSFSDDGSWEFFQKFADDSRVRLYQVPREGIYAGWNECLKRVRGDYVYMATSDDGCSPGILEKLVGVLEDQPELHLATCGLDEVDERGMKLPPSNELASRFLGEWGGRRCIRKGETEFLLNIPFGPLWGSITALLFRRSLLDQVGMFSPAFGPLGDAEWALRACLASDVAFLPDKLATWRRHASQASSTGWDFEGRRRMYHMLQQVLHDCESRLPTTWKQLPGWRSTLLKPRWLEMAAQLDLYRWVARAEPGRFFRGLGQAMRLQPQWALGRAIRGFPAGPESEYDPAGAAKSLLESFGAAWPPRELEVN